VTRSRVDWDDARNMPPPDYVRQDPRCTVCGHPAHGGPCPRERFVPPDETPVGADPGREEHDDGTP